MIRHSASTSPPRVNSVASPAGSGSCDNFSRGLVWIIADITPLYRWFRYGFRIVTGNYLIWRVLLCILGCSLAGALSHLNDNPTFFGELHPSTLSSGRCHVHERNRCFRVL